MALSWGETQRLRVVENAVLAGVYTTTEALA